MGFRVVGPFIKGRVAGPSRPEELRVNIFKTPLDAEHRVWPHFRALSYAWGDPRERVDLLVVGLDDDPSSPVTSPPRRLPVTQNLATALSYIVQPDRFQVLWVDAVCINQDDLDERAEQVQLMPQIYESAEMVYGWVGPPTDDSNLAINLLHTISNSIDVDWQRYEIRPKESRWTREMPGYVRLLLDPNFPLSWDGPESQALESFFDRSCFERLWVRQEITLGGKRSLLMCGESSIDWWTFRKAAILLKQKITDHDHPRLAYRRNRNDLIMDICIHNSVWLGHLLRQMQRAMCTDPRDRVYGIFGILPKASAPLANRIKPDYLKPVVEVYKDLVLADKAVTARADLLSECRMPKNTTSGWKPSWVPDWSSSRNRSLTLIQQCADGQSAVEVLYVDQDSLHSHNSRCYLNPRFDCLHQRDEKENESAPGQTPPLPPSVAFIKKAAETLDLSPDAPYRPVPRGSIAEALCYAISGGGLVKDHVSEEMIASDAPSLAQFKRVVNFALGFSDEDMKPGAAQPDEAVKREVLACASIMAKECSENILFITEEGHVGAGPAATRPGDQIAVILGCMRPLLLRCRNRDEDVMANSKEEKSEQSTDAFSIVGPCHAHGLNWGEAILGPLPQGTTLIWSFSGPFGNPDPAFRDRDVKRGDSGGPAGRLGPAEDRRSEVLVRTETSVSC
jgi:hypothetical protein